jgi:hypothetical protein
VAKLPMYLEGGGTDSRGRPFSRAHSRWASNELGRRK